MILTLISIFILIGLLSYYIIFSRIKISSFPQENIDFNKAVSVIICAKNELENIKSFFPFWINQNFHDFELIIVNDQSDDGSLEYLSDLEKKYENLKVINISKNETKVLKGKRHALFKGIEASKNNYLLFTDADCKPFSTDWIKELTKAFYNSKTEIVLGYSPYKKEKGFLNKLIQYETILTALQYFGFAEAGLPYMSIGRNVAYKKSILNYEVFLKSNKSISGDDDLIFQQVSHKENTEYILSQNSLTISKPAKSYKDWFYQKKRHLGAGIHYKLKFKVLLGVFVLLNIGFMFSILILLVNLKILFLTSLIILKILIINILITNNYTFKIKKVLNVHHFLLIDLIYWFIYIIFALAQKFECLLQKK